MRIEVKRIMITISNNFNNKLDNLDIQILGHLLEDGRMAFKEIGRKLETTSVTVKNRLNNMFRDGAIREISPKINGKLRVWSFTYILGSQVLSPSHNFLGAYKLYLPIITSTFHLLYYPFLILYFHIFHPNIIFSSI